MSLSLILSLTALFALFPASLLAFRNSDGKFFLQWVLIILALLVVSLKSFISVINHWHTDFSTTLWISVTTCLIIFCIICLRFSPALKLTVILFPYLIILSILAILFEPSSNPKMALEANKVWFIPHVVICIITYGFVTLAAIAGISVTLKQKDLKMKRNSAFVKLLPAILEMDVLQLQLLKVSVLVLGIGLASGTALQFFQSGMFFIFNHKSILALIGFLILLGIIFAHIKTGTRGPTAARLILTAYLLLTLAYPGVKFVTEVIL